VKGLIAAVVTAFGMALLPAAAQEPGRRSSCM
jgi:hypothetical protein